jgi:hypothetical protein
MVAVRCMTTRFDTCARAEFRPQLLQKRLTEGTSESKTEILFNVLRRVSGFTEMSHMALSEIALSAAYEEFQSGKVRAALYPIV